MSSIRPSPLPRLHLYDVNHALRGRSQRLLAFGSDLYVSYTQLDSRRYTVPPATGYQFHADKRWLIKPNGHGFPLFENAND
jgi:hypothetical protein